MLKVYNINGKEWLFEEGKQPEGAIEKQAAEPPKQKRAEPDNKTVTPKNKARKAAVK